MSVDPWLPTLVRVRASVRETHDTVTLTLDAPGGAYRFLPGQFSMLWCHGQGEVPLSFSGDPAETDAVRHTIRAVGATTRALVDAAPGDVLGLRGPFGTSWPLDVDGADVLVVAGGLGLAPLRPAILALLARRGDRGRITLIAGARTPSDLCFRDELRAWATRGDVDVHLTVDRPEPGWTGAVGLVTTTLTGVTIDPLRTLALVCGPDVMMREAARALRGRGVPAERIHLSMERDMKCALGHCGHCQWGEAFLCRDGAVVPWTRAERLLTVREL